MSSNKDLKVLVVDDEPDIVEMLQYNLSKEGYQVKVAENGKVALDLAREFKPDLVLLDIMMPVLDGVEACRQMREIEGLKNTYILFLTARSEEFSEVAAFEAGADDFINKPIRPRALIQRVAAFFRRSTGGKKNDGFIDFGVIRIDRESYTVYKNGEPLPLPKKEFELLSYLASNPNKVYSRDELLQSIWGADIYVLARTVDVHIRKVREKIGEDYIKTVKGVGYKFQNPNETRFKN